MSVLKVAGLVIDRRDAQWVCYWRAGDLPAAITDLVDAALAIKDTQWR